MNFPEGSAEAVFMSLPKNWKETVRNVFASGGSVVEAHLAIEVQGSIHKELMKIATEYLEEFENGIAVSEAYWIKWAREALEPVETEVSKDGNTVNVRVYGKPDTKLFEIMMKQLFDWNKKLDKPDESDAEKKSKAKDEAGKIAGKLLRKIK